MEYGITRVGDGWDIRSMRGIGIGEMIIGRELRLHTVRTGSRFTVRPN